MVLSDKSSALDKSLGIYIELKESVLGYCFHSCTSQDPWRKWVTIYLNKDGSSTLESQFLQTLISVEEGKRWPIRLDWSNVKEFFSAPALRQIENRLTNISFYLYNAAELDSRKVNTAKMYYSMQYQKRKQKAQVQND